MRTFDKRRDSASELEPEARTVSPLSGREVSL